MYVLVKHTSRVCFTHVLGCAQADDILLFVLLRLTMYYYLPCQCGLCTSNTSLLRSQHLIRNEIYFCNIDVHQHN